MAAFAIPAVNLLGSIGGGIFNHHAAAVKNEAAVLNAATPQFIKDVQSIFTALNARQIDANSAKSYVDSAVSSYYANVSSIIKKGGACNPSSKFGAPDPCNGPCNVGCSSIEIWAAKAKALIDQGSGTLQIPASAGAVENGQPRSIPGFSAPAWSVTLNPLPGSSQATTANPSLSTGSVGVPIGATGNTVPFSSQSGSGSLLGTSTPSPTLSGILSGSSSVPTWILAGVALLTLAVSLGGHRGR